MPKKPPTKRRRDPTEPVPWFTVSLTVLGTTVAYANTATRSITKARADCARVRRGLQGFNDSVFRVGLVRHYNRNCPGVGVMLDPEKEKHGTP
jgi:hypothetical protein